jgi:hypothetical protein
LRAQYFCSHSIGSSWPAFSLYVAQMCTIWKSVKTAKRGSRRDDDAVRV